MIVSVVFSQDEPRLQVGCARYGRKEIKANTTEMSQLTWNKQKQIIWALRGIRDTHAEHFIMSVTLLEDGITGERVEGMVCERTWEENN